MAQIHLLDSSTIDKIAAGEVVERPASVVKELVENAMDAGAAAVTVEIRDGGCSFIRVTDNGGGIDKSEIRKAFCRHATSKIRSAEDLFRIQSLGFRGEALSSIAAVSMVELISKTKDQLTGVHYRLEGGVEKEFSEVGAPDGTTIIARELFFNTPVRKKFLKSPSTEGSYVSDLMEHMALSRPDVAFQFMVNGNVKFHTSGNGDLKEIVYRLYGRQLTRELIPFRAEGEQAVVEGFLGSPSTVRSNRNFEFFFVNGRYVRSPLLSKGLEAGYKAYLMQHKFPFALLHVRVAPENIDVNVHPSKMEVRFHDQPGLYAFLEEKVRQAMHSRELIPDITLDEPSSGRPARSREQDSGKERPPISAGASRESVPRPEPVSAPDGGQNAPKKSSEKNAAGLNVQGEARPEPGKISLKERENQEKPIPEKSISEKPAQEKLTQGKPEQARREQSEEAPEQEEQAAPVQVPASYEQVRKRQAEKPEAPQPFETVRLQKMLQEEAGQYEIKHAEQMELFDGKLLSREAARHYRILGQVFDTYWIVQYEDRLMFVDQHAAHEKVKYEALIKKMRSNSVESQNLTPPLVINLSAREVHTLKAYESYFASMGFEIEDFGGNAVTVRAVPCELYGHHEKDFLQEILDELEEAPPHGTPSVIEEKLASMACKSAVKGNTSMTHQEMEALLDQLMKLENPYHCPHGRPTIIVMSKYELEKKFKRIV